MDIVQAVVEQTRWPHQLAFAVHREVRALGQAITIRSLVFT